jgi:ribose-phosphate pyrophosphokinase
MIDTAGTLVKAAGELKKFGAKRVFAFASHGLFNGKAIELIKNSELERVVVTNTIPASDEKRIDKIVYLSVGPLLAEAIKCIQCKSSVSALFSS